MRKAESDQPALLRQVAYIGTLGLLLILPAIGGAYLGRWLDSRTLGFSTSWTISLIIVGLFVGAFNVYLLLKEDESGE